MRILAIILTVLFLVGAGLSPAISQSVKPSESEIHTSASCTSSTGAALAANEGRRAAWLQNDGTSAIWLGIGVAAVANIGIKLVPNASYFISAGSYNYSRAAVNCITASATVLLNVTEWSNN